MLLENLTPMKVQEETKEETKSFNREVLCYAHITLNMLHNSLLLFISVHIYSFGVVCYAKTLVLREVKYGRHMMGFNRIS